MRSYAQPTPGSFVGFAALRRAFARVGGVEVRVRSARIESADTDRARWRRRRAQPCAKYASAPLPARARRTGIDRRRFSRVGGDEIVSSSLRLGAVADQRIVELPDDAASRDRYVGIADLARLTGARALRRAQLTKRVASPCEQAAVVGQR